MTLDQFYLLLCGFLGVIFHTLVKYKTLRDDAHKANIKLPFVAYLKDDFVSILTAMLSVLIWYFVFKEIGAKYHSVEDFARVSFVTMGVMGSWLIQTFMSRAKKKIQKAVDEKSNIADGKTPPAND